MKEIPLTRGFVTQVDDDDYDELMRYKWHVVTPNANKIYATRNQYHTETQTQTMVYLHRQIMNTPANKLTDHRDGNGLNNQRSNLRIVTHSQNALHCHAVTGAVPYRGVHKSSRNTFTAHFMICGKIKYLGSWSIAEDAARAYDEAMLRYSPEYGVPNFPDAATFDYAIWRSEATGRNQDHTFNARALKGSRPKVRQGSIFRGVHEQQGTGDKMRFIARISARGEKYYLGYFADPVLAALAYDAKARELGKPEESLNFPVVLQ